MEIHLPEVAESVYASYIEAELARQRGHFLESVLVALGYGNWLLPGESYLDGDTPSRQAKIMASIASQPWGPAAIAALVAVWSGAINPADRDSIPRRVAWTQRYCRIEGSTVFWGLEETVGLDLLFRWKYHQVYLRVLDGKDLVADRVSTVYANEVSLAELGCNDDDYRFEVGCEGPSDIPGRGVPRDGSYFDFAEIDGVWQPLPWKETGHEWSGEWAGSQRVHVPPN